MNEVSSISVRSGYSKSYDQLEASIRFEISPEGWIQWPGREDLSQEFMRLLAAAQEGGSTIAECWLAASRIDPSDDNSWHREWIRIAEANEARGVAALDEGNIITARSNWLRAISYYFAAASPLDVPEDKRRSAAVSMRSCARAFLQYREPAGEIVSIPWLKDFTLQGYYLPARAKGRATPVIVCIGEPGHQKEEFLFKMARYAKERELSLLAVDLLGDGNGVTLEDVVRREKIEPAIGYIVDHVAAREDVDENRIAILADGWGSSFVARGIAYDERIAAAVCDGGIWDLNERTFLSRRAALRGREAVSGSTNYVLRHIDSPLLITVGERGSLKAEWVTELADRLKADHRDTTLKVFKVSETGSAQGHADNPTLANEFTFDWIASRLNTVVERR